MDINVDKVVEKVTDIALNYGPKLVMAILTLIIGLWVIKKLKKVIVKILDRTGLDNSIKPYLAGMLATLLKVLLIISVAGMLGFQTTSFIAILGAAGLAVGMALQGSLGNFAGGVLILLFKPIKVGDYVKAQGFEGIVKEIQVFVTVLTTLDNQTIYIPNGALGNGPIQNLSVEEKRRVDMTFGVSYNDDLDKSRSVIQSVLDKSDKILKSPAADILVSEHGDSSVNFAVRPWCKNADYWDVYFYCHEEIKKAFDKENISIPYPHSEVYMHNVNT